MRTLATPRPIRLALLALALPLAFADAPAAADGPGRAALRPSAAVRDASSLLAHRGIERPSVPMAGGFVTPTDSFLVVSHAFQTTAGACLPGLWSGENRAPRVYAHVSTRTVNRTVAFGLGTAATDILLPSPRSTTALRDPLAVALNDSGRVVLFSSTRSNPALGGIHAIAVHPDEDLLRAYSTDLGSLAVVRTAAFHPPTASVVFGAGGSLMRLPSGGGAPLPFAGDPAGPPVDTTANVANIAATGIAVDAAGNVYFAEAFTHRVRVVRTDMRVVTLAGTGAPGFSGDGGPAVLAALDGPTDVAVDPAATTLWIADRDNHRVRTIDLASGIITTALGDGAPETLPGPHEIAHSAGDLYVAVGGDGDPVRVLRVAGGAGEPTVVYGGDALYQPVSEHALGRHVDAFSAHGLTPDGTGGLYFADAIQGLVYRLRAEGDIEVVAGLAADMLMGVRALWVGADAMSAPDEVAQWVDPAGYGGAWSQRAVSPPFDLAAHPGAELAFDLALGLAPGAEGFVLVQGRRADGTWATLEMDVVAGPQQGLSLDGFPTTAIRTGHVLAGRGIARITVELDSPSNAEALPPAPGTRLRIVVATPAVGTNEDGLGGSSDGAAALDNLSLRDGAVDLIGLADFEDGSIGEWSLDAFNHVIGDGEARAIDPPPAALDVALRTGFDPADPSCAWTFVNAAGEVPAGALARLVSPWTPLADPAAPFVVTFSGRLSPTDQARLLNVIVRGRRSGESRPAEVVAASFLLHGGASGGDLAAPFVVQRALRFPDDFVSGFSAAMDEIQIVFQVEDRGGQAAMPPLVGRPATRLPFLDDVRVWQVGVDQDYDGVPDLADECPTDCAAGQDADGDGCPEPTATMRHVESWAGGQVLPVAIAEGADPHIGDASDVAAIEQGFMEWAAVEGANVQIALTVPAPGGIQNASATDRLNLVTFRDPDFQFPANVLAVTPTTSFTRRQAVDDEVVLPGQIVDSDMIFNPAARFSTPTTPGPPGSPDLRSVTAHEAGHFFGIGHSGVLDATMFFVIQEGVGAASLEDDDRAAIAAAYPAANLETAFAAIRGVVTRGATGEALPGALVTAVRLDGADAPVDSTASDYTDETGRYALLRLPPGRYAVRVTPLDGNVGGFPFSPGFVSERLAAIAETNFQAEWWSTPETDRDDPSALAALLLAAGETRAEIDVVTNVDTIAPRIVAVAPTDDTTDVRIDAAIVVAFSEAVEPTSLGAAFRLHVEGSAGRLGGQGVLLANGRTFVFTPDAPLAAGTNHVVEITTALVDREGVALETTFESRFTTQEPAPLAITDIQPRAVAPGGLVTLMGAGFEPQSPGADRVQFTPCFGCEGDPVEPLRVTATSMVVRVPAYAASGPVRVIQDPYAESNPFPLTVLPRPGQASPAPTGVPIPLAFAPTDVAVAPDGLTVYAVGDGGLATINREPARGPVDVAVVHAIDAAAQILLSADGATAYVSLPASAAVAIVDADPVSGTFGAVRQTVALPAKSEPRGLALSPSGRRLYATDGPGRRVIEIDVDPASATRWTTVGELDDPAATLTGGIAVSRLGDALVYTSTLPGARSRALGGSGTSAPVTVAPMTHDAVAAHPDGTEYLLTTRTGGLRFHRPGAPSTTLVLGGQPRDVAFTPQGQSALVANGTFNRLEVVGTDTTDASWHVKVAEVATGFNPVAVAIGAHGDLAAVACFGSREVRLYTLGGGDTYARLVPAVAMPGDAAVAQGANTDLFSSGTQVDVGGAVESALATSGFAASFRVPPSAQRTTSATLVGPGGERSNALPLTIVDPIASLAPRSTGRAFRHADAICSPDTGVTRYAKVAVSPDGRVLASAWLEGYLGDCVTIDLFRTSSAGAEEFGQRFATAGGLDVDATDLAFTPDSKRLWVSNTLGGGIRFYDADPESPTPGAIVGGTGFGTDDVEHIAADPLGRFMLVSHMVSRAVRRVDFDGSNLGTLARASVEAIRSLAVSPDGRYAVAGLHGNAEIFDLATGAAIVTLERGGGEFDAVEVGITADGRRAVGRFNFNLVVVWNLDPTFGPIGAELFVGPVVGANLVGDVVPAPNGTAVLMANSSTNRIVRVDTRTIPPIIETGEVGTPSAGLARTPDGRHLVVAPSVIEGPTGDLRLVTLSEATGFDVASGAGQVAAAGATLPQPVRIRVRDAAGRPQAGAIVVFRTLSTEMGTLDHLPGRTIVHRFTDVQGEAAIAWTLPAEPGAVELRVSVLGVSGETAVGAVAAASDADIAPVVVALGPADGTIGVNAGTAVFARFNQPMDSVSVTGAMALTAAGAAVAGSFTLEDGGRLVLFRPTQALPFSAACALMVGAGALDRDGQSLATGATATFTIQPVPALALTAISPPSAAPGAPVVLAGQGFSIVPAQNLVRFNGIPAPVAAATATELTVNVPLEALSGEVTVQLGLAVSNALGFVVLGGTGVGGVVETVDVGAGAREVAVTPDGSRAYVTNPVTGTVTALDIQNVATITTIAVGALPRGIVVLPDGSRAYVANAGSGTVSVIDVNPASPTYHQVVGVVATCPEPVDVAVSPVGPEVLVVCAGDAGALQTIDANPGNGTFDQVIKTVNTGQGGVGVGVSPDGTRAYVLGEDGVITIVDLAGDAVISTVNTGQGGVGVAVSPDGTLLFALLADGTIAIVDLVPGSPSENRVIRTVNTGQGGVGVGVSPDGGLLFVTNGDGNTVAVFEIVTSGGGGSTSIVPGAPVSLRRIADIPVGDNPAGLAFDPSRNGFVLVVNQASGSVTVIGDPGSVGPIEISFDFDFNVLDLVVFGPLVRGFFEPPPDLDPHDIVFESIRLAGVVAPAQPIEVKFDDYDDDGIPDAEVRFSRDELRLALPEGEKIEVVATGVIGTRRFFGSDRIDVEHAQIHSPAAGDVCAPGDVHLVRWTNPPEADVSWIAVLLSTNDGASWRLEGRDLPETEAYAWDVPAVVCDSARIAVVLVEGPGPREGEVLGVLGVSDRFRISGVTRVEAAPAVLSLAPVWPNPARGDVQVRFGLPRAADVAIEVFDVQGRRVATLARGARAPGWHEARWSGANAAGEPVGAGLYVVRFRAEGRTLEERIVWLR